MNKVTLSLAFEYWKNTNYISRDLFINIISNLKNNNLDYMNNKWKEYLINNKIFYFQSWMTDVKNIRKLYEVLNQIAYVKELNFDKNIEEIIETFFINNEGKVNLDNYNNINNFNILYYDIETTGFSGGFNTMLMYAYKWNNEETKLDSLHFEQYKKDLNDLPPELADRQLVINLAEKFNKADIIVGHYNQKFDNKFLQTRSLIHKLPIIDDRSSSTLDTYRIAKYKCKFSNNRLKTIAKELNLNEQKSEVDLITWQRSKVIGDNRFFLEALEKIGEYCKQDVNTLYEIAKVFSPLATHLPNLQLINNSNDNNKLLCPSCGANVEFVKYVTLKSNIYQQYQCINCGKWVRSTNPEKINFNKRNRLTY